MRTEHTRALRRRSTDCERALWHQLRNRQIELSKFRRQHAIDRYIVDFVCIEKRLIVEVDGGQHAERIKYDEERSKLLESRGFRVLRFWNNEIQDNMNGVLETIRSALLEAPSPQPSPASGRGSLHSGFDQHYPSSGNQISKSRVLSPSPHRGEGRGEGKAQES